MSSAEHLIENLIFGMKRGETCEEILNYPVNKVNLSDCSMTEDEAVRIAVHVVYGLYDGRFPDQNCENCEFYIPVKGAPDYCTNSEVESPFCARLHWCKLFKEKKDR